MLRRGRQYVLLTSEGEFGECSYKTTFRRSAKLTDWSRAKRQVLVDTKKSGLCGPGGADLGRGPSGEPMLFFHAWTCPELGGNCPGGHNYDREPAYDARRSLFAGVLRFTSRQSPRIASYVAPILAAAATAHATPTPTPTDPTTTISRSSNPGASRRSRHRTSMRRRTATRRRRAGRRGRRRAAPPGCRPACRRTGGR